MTSRPKIDVQVTIHHQDIRASGFVTTDNEIIFKANKIGSIHIWLEWFDDLPDVMRISTEIEQLIRDKFYPKSNDQ